MPIGTRSTSSIRQAEFPRVREAVLAVLGQAAPQEDIRHRRKRGWFGASGGGVSCRMALSVAGTVSRRNGCCPANIWDSTTPKAKTSARASTGCAWTCSGAM